MSILLVDASDPGELLMKNSKMSMEKKLLLSTADTADLVWSLYGVKDTVKAWRNVCEDHREPRRSHQRHLFLKPHPDPKRERESKKNAKFFGGQTYARKVEQSGKFLCPLCLQRRAYKEKSVHLSCHSLQATLPIVVEKSQELESERYVKCNFCCNHFDPLVLEWGQVDPETVLETAMFVGIANVLDKGGPAAAFLNESSTNVSVARHIYESVCGRKVMTNETILSLVKSRPSSGDISLDFMVYSHFLDEEEKSMILQALFSTADPRRRKDLFTDKHPFRGIAQVAKGLGVNLYRAEQILIEVQTMQPNQTEINNSAWSQSTCTTDVEEGFNTSRTAMD